MTIISALIVIGVFVWLTLRGSVPALTANRLRTIPPTASQGALAYARRRLERGEIGPEDYERIVAVLQS